MSKMNESTINIRKDNDSIRKHVLTYARKVYIVMVTSKKSAHPSFISILCIFLTRLLKKRAQNVLFYPYSGANPPRIWNYSLKWA